jgi:S-adenosylmethionine hydrolase
MARSQNSFIKKQREKKKQMKKKLKEERKKERQENSVKGGDLADMMAYVDEFGNITSESPEEAEKRKKEEEEKRKKDELERRRREGQ